MPFIQSRDPFVMVPGGASIPWPPQEDHYTDQAKRALAFAQDEAARLNHNHIGAVHVLVGAQPAVDACTRRGPQGLQIGKGSIQFQADKPLQAALVTKLVKARIVENGKVR